MRSPTPKGFDDLVARQVRRWALDEARRRPLRPSGIVALSRLPGAGGAELGRRVAEALGFGFFGIELVDHIARERGIHRELVIGLDEHVRATIERFVIDAFRPPAFTESDYLRDLIRTLATLQERGMAVVLGRGSAQVLPPERALRVMAVAPRAFRVERLAKARDLDAHAASRRLDGEEAGRRQFLTHHFHVDPDEPTGYDLVVNTAALGFDGAAELVVRAFEARFPGPEPRAAAAAGSAAP